MFNGIIAAVGTILKILSKNIFYIKTSLYSQVIIGSSVACSGVCLTVIEITDDGFVVEVSNETFSCTNLGNWEVGHHMNLELSMKIGGRLDGHFVLGHVDSIVQLTDLRLLTDDCYKMIITAPEKWMRYIVYKGSVAIDGVSLTVNEVNNNCFSINLLPYTFHHTTFQYNKPSDILNMEVDVLARYTERMLHYAS